MLDDSGINYSIRDRGSDDDRPDAPEATETRAPQSLSEPSDDVSLASSGAAEPDNTAPLANNADSAITVASNTPVTPDGDRAGVSGSSLSADEASEIFGSGTNAAFLMLAEGAVSQNPLSGFADNAVFDSAMPGAEVAEIKKNSEAAPQQEFRRLLTGPGAPETDNLALAVDDVGQSSSIAASQVTVAVGAAAAINSASTQSVTFAGSTGTLILDDALAFAGQVSGLTGSDAIDLADVSYGPSTQVTFLGNTAGGTLTISNGTQTANIALVGNYLSSTWDLSSDGSGGTIVVDPVSANNWQTLDIGAGGNISGIDAVGDVMVIRTDTYGAYIWNGTEWQQLITATSMPAAFLTPDNAEGVSEIQIAPSNTNILYMEYDGYVFKSTNDGTTWTETNFAPVAMYPNASYKQDGQQMAIDPNNPNVVYAGTAQNGLFVTTNGGSTWQSVSQVPTAMSDGNGGYPGITGILFDPAIGGTNSLGETNTIFAASYGYGVYESTNAGASWSLLSGSPTYVQDAAVSSTGVYYVTDGTSLLSYANGVWTDLLNDPYGGDGIHAIAVNPNNPNEIVVQYASGQLDVSYNAGATWSGFDQSYTWQSTDIPWLANIVSPGGYLGSGDIIFNPANSGQLVATSGLGVITTSTATLPTSTTSPYAWTDQSLGIEQLVSTQIIVPLAGDPIDAVWDRGFFQIDNPDAEASSYGPVNGAFSEGWALDYASSDPSFVVGVSDQYGQSMDSVDLDAAYSTNGGQTWQAFASNPPWAATSAGGMIAASTPENIIWSACGEEPYYTLNGGQTWNPVVLPGVSASQWSNFDFAYYLDQHLITADRVLANTFYLFFPDVGVFTTTNGGQSWTQVYSGALSAGDYYVSLLQSVPGEAGNLFFTGGPQAGGTLTDPVNEPFMRSTNGGATWTAVPNVSEVCCFGYGAAAPGESYPAIYIVGWVNNVYGVWQSINNAQSWTQIGTWPNNSLDTITTISGDPGIYGQVYVGFAGSGAAYLAAGPLVSAVAASPSSGIEVTGNTITITLTMTEVVTVTGTPTLSLNDGGTATYTGGSGTGALTFSYTVAGTDSDVSALEITQANLPNGATITDSSGNAANLSKAVETFSGLQIETTGPTVTSVVESPPSGSLNKGQTVTLTLDLNQVVTVNTAGGAPTLTLNDGGTATYQSGSGTDALVFSYTVATGQSTPSLAATALNLNGASITDGAGYTANLSLSGLTQTGPQISTLTASSLAVDGNGFYATSSYSTSNTVTLSTTYVNDVIILNVAENGTTVASVSDTAGLTWQLRAVAGSSSNDNLIYQYYAISPNALSADVITVNYAGGASAAELNAFGVAGANTSSPFDANASIPATANSGAASATTSNANDLIFAAYRFNSDASPSAGSGWTAINASGDYYLSEYKVVSATQAGLAATASTTDENGGIVDAIVAASQPTGPSISSVSATAGDYDSGKLLTLTLNMTETVTVTGTPTLTLNDGGTATYVSGSGSNTLTFSYTVGAGQNTAALQATAVTGTIKDSNGNTLSTASLPETFSGVIIDTTTPTISAISESPSSGDLDAGKTVTYTLTMSEVVTVNTSGGAPTLSLNDGGTATYVSGSGTGALTFSYTVLAGQNTPDLMVSAVNSNGATVQDGAGNTANLSISGLSQGSPQIDTTPPTVSAVTATAGDYDAGKVLTLTLNMSEAVNVTGTPTLTLNDGGTANYVSGTGSSALVFSYTVGAGQNTAALQVTGITGTIADLAGNALSTTGLPETFTGVIVDTTTPTISAIAESPSTGDLDAGKTVTFTLTTTEAVTVSTTGGTPTLTLNDGGTATYTSGSGTTALTFSYTVGAGQNTAALAATALNLNGGTIKDGAGNAASLSLTGLTQTGPQIDTTAPTVSSVTGAAGDYNAGKVLTLTLNMSEAVAVTGTPTLSLNDGGTATYVSGSGTSALTFSYTVLAGQNTAALQATTVAGTITDLAGNALTTSSLPQTLAGVIVNTTGPAISSLTESPSSGDLDAGKTVTLTLNLSEAVTVAGGTPTLTLNDGGTATYTSGSGTSALTFSYTVGAGQNTAALKATAVNLNSATITDGAGNAASLSLTGLTQTGPQVDTTAPTISSLAESPSSGDLDAGKTVTLTLNLSEAVTVAGGTPTLTLNDGGTATYTSGSGTSALTFSYTVAAGQNTAALTATAVNLNSATITDGAGNAASLSLTGLTQTGPQIDTTTPTISSLTESPSSGDLDAGKTVTLTLNFSEAVTVAGGTPTLTLNDGSTATYTSGSGTSALTFSYTVAAGQNTAALTATALNLNGGTIKDGAGNAASLSLTGLTQTGPQIDTIAPTISSLTESPSSGDLDAGKTVTLTLNLSEAVTVAGGTPTLTLNDGGTATYTSGSGTSALTFSYTVGAGQNTAALTATAVNLNSATITDGAGNAASLSLTGLTQTGPQIDTTGPAISSLTESPSSGDLDAGKTVTLTLNLSEAVTVAGGTPTLTLNDGGTATYTSGSGTSALTFSYTVGAGQNTAALKATAVNLNSATITDGAGNAASLSLTGLTQTGPQVDTTAPTISSLAESPSSGDLDAGKTVTLTLNLSEAVTVAGGTPTLTLNDGGTATYTSGSGTSALTFSYTVAAGQNTAALTATAVNLNSATITDGAGNAASLSLTGLTQTGPQIDTTTPTISSLTESPSSGDLDAGKTVTLTLNFSEAVTVAGGTPTLTLNDGSTATYTSGSGTSALTFSYTVAAGQNTAALTATALNLNGGTIKDGAGNAASLSLTGLTQTGPQIDTIAPTISSLTESPSSGDLDAGKTVTLTLNLSEAVTVAGGTPTLTLNDGGTATYTSGSGTSALTFSYTVGAGQNTAALTATAVNLNSATITDGAGNAASLSLTGLTQTGPQIDTTAPTVSSVAATAGDYGAGQVLTLTLNMSGAVNVTGTPTLTLNDGGAASYVSGSGSNTLVFSYTVALGQNTAALKVTGYTGTITDAAGNALSTTGLPETFAGVTVVTTPTISAIAESPSSGDLDAGKTVTLTLNLSEAVTVAGGTPTLTLNDGSTATYNGGSGTNALTFSYTIGAGQNTPELAATAVNLNGAVIQDGAGNPATLSLAGLTQTGPQIDTTTPTVTAILETPSSGDLGVGKTVTYTLTMSEAVTVNTSGGTPTFSLNDGGTATYISGSGTNALTFSYTVLAGQSAADLMISTVNLNGATVQDGAGNAANLSLSGLNQGSPQIDTTTPAVSSIIDSPSSGDLNAGHVVTLTLNMTEAVTVVGGAPTLALNDGGTATYAGGSGTTALTFSYTAAAGQNTAALAATAINLNGATIADGAGNAANFSLSGLTQSGPQIETAAPTVVAAATTPAGGDLETGDNATITVTMSEIVNVTGTPTLALNDGGSATYLSGSGSSTLVFGYTAGASEKTAALQLTGAVSGGSITDAAGNTAVIAPTSLNLQVNTDQWKNATSGNWTTNTDWSSPAGAPAGTDTVMLDAPGTFQVTSTANENISDLNTVSTATLAISHSIFSVSNGTAGGVQAGIVSVGAGGTLDINGVFDNTGTIWARGGIVNINGSLAGGTTSISGNGQVWINQPSNENVSFGAASTGFLVLQDSGYNGWISGFGNNQSQSIDISGLKFNRSSWMAYVPNRADTAGTLYIENRTTAVTLQLTGTYTLSDFQFGSDGSGGTLLTDPKPAAVSNNAPMSIGNGAVSVVNAPDSGDVTFTGRSGTLDLAQPSGFTGTVSDFAAKNRIDLLTMAFDAQTEVSYSPKRNGTGGVLSISNGVISTQIALLGQYTAASFGLMSDQHGGTMVVYEPPQSSNQPTLSNPHHG